MKIIDIAMAVANLFNNCGPDRCVLLAHMATRPKEDSLQDPLEDELIIMRALRKVGFGAQQSVRMLLRQPDGIESGLVLGDWHADSRLCYLCPDDTVARGLDNTPLATSGECRANWHAQLQSLFALQCLILSTWFMSLKEE